MPNTQLYIESIDNIALVLYRDKMKKESITLFESIEGAIALAKFLGLTSISKKDATGTYLITWKKEKERVDL